MTSKALTVALAGNPNSGKTTVFNNLTGAKQHVGNYPGVTVEKKEGQRRHDGFNIRFVDLPGTYSLTAYSIEEVVTRNFIIEESPDIVVDVIDASNLERNLYLGVQLMELRVPLVFAFNMSDVARRRGFEFQTEMLSELLGAPIVETVGNKAQGMDALLDTIVSVARGEMKLAPRPVRYGREIEEELDKIEALLSCSAGICGQYNPRWVGLKLLEEDTEVAGNIERLGENPAEVTALVERSKTHLEQVYGDPAEIVISDRRYGFISGACQETVRSTVESRHDMSDRIDSVLANRALGLPIFALLMFLVFQLTFLLGDAPMEWLEAFFHWLSSLVSGFWSPDSDSVIRSLIVDGILGGVGGVVAFLPNILLLFLAIAFLEDTGYMARAAFLVDRFMHRIGLHGKSFIPMLIGFGCTVPAIMATRTLENERDRMTTILVLPLMSCGARLPIYALIIPAFFPASIRGTLLFTVYLIGILLSLILALLLRKTLFRGDSSPFVMELPPYRMPTVRSLVLHMWERSWIYLRKAGTVILLFSVAFWALYTFPRKTETDQDYAALKARARTAYLDRSQDLAQRLGAPAAEGVRNRLEAELWLKDTTDHFDDDSPERQAAAKTLGEVTRLSEQGVQGERIRSVFFLRGRIRAIEEKAVEDRGEEADTPQWQAAMFFREKSLADLARSDAEGTAIALALLTKAEKPYQETVDRLTREEGAEILKYTIAGRIGRGLEVVVKPLGFDWRISTAIVGAFPAKELFVAQLGVVSAVGESEESSQALRSFLRRNYSPLQAFCIMLFTLISIPCMATLAVTRRETGSWKWAALQIGGLTAVAYIITLIVYQGGTLLGIGG